MSAKKRDEKQEQTRGKQEAGKEGNGDRGKEASPNLCFHTMHINRRWILPGHNRPNSMCPYQAVT